MLETISFLLVVHLFSDTVSTYTLRDTCGAPRKDWDPPTSPSALPIRLSSRNILKRSTCVPFRLRPTYPVVYVSESRDPPVVYLVCHLTVLGLILGTNSLIKLFIRQLTNDS